MHLSLPSLNDSHNIVVIGGGYTLFMQIYNRGYRNLNMLQVNLLYKNWQRVYKVIFLANKLIQSK